MPYIKRLDSSEVVHTEVAEIEKTGSSVSRSLESYIMTQNFKKTVLYKASKKSDLWFWCQK